MPERVSSTHDLCQAWPDRSSEELQKWCDERQIRRSRGLTVNTASGNWGVFATRDYAAGEILCQIPKTALLSVKTSSLPPLLPADHLKPNSSHTILHLALCLLHEFRLGRDSPFYGYIQSLPRDTILLPSFWSDRDLAGEDGLKASKIISGTEVERHMAEKAKEGLSLDDCKHFYDTLSPHLPLTTAYPLPSPWTSFAHCLSLVCSRAFIIDLYHIIALCPFADLFNHSSTSPHTSLSSDDFVCHVCGSLKACPHDVLSTDGTALRLDHLSAEWQRKVAVEQDTVDMRVDTTIEAGQEVFNSYGENLGDARLLNEWGFVEEESTGGPITFESKLEGQKREDIVDIVLDDPSLLGPGSSLTIDSDGVISVGLFAAVVADMDPVYVRTTIKEVMTAWKRLDAEETEIHLGMSERATVAVDKVVRLLDQRLKQLYCHNRALDELFDLKENLAANDTLQQMALSALINERRLLESTREKWSDLLDIALADMNSNGTRGDLSIQGS